MRASHGSGRFPILALARVLRRSNGREGGPRLQQREGVDSVRQPVQGREEGGFALDMAMEDSLAFYIRIWGFAVGEEEDSIASHSNNSFTSLLFSSLLFS